MMNEQPFQCLFLLNFVTSLLKLLEDNYNIISQIKIRKTNKKKRTEIYLVTQKTPAF